MADMPKQGAIQLSAGEYAYIFSLHRIQELLDAVAAVDDSLKTPSTITTGSVDVATPGTAVVLSETSVPCRKVVVFAKKSNTDEIFIGGSTIDKDNDFGYNARESQTIEIDNLNKVFIDAVVVGEGVNFLVVS